MPLALAAQLPRVLGSVNSGGLFIWPPPPLHPESLKVCTWNVWEGGGVHIAHESTLVLTATLEELPKVNFPTYGQRRTESISTKKGTFSQILLVVENDIFCILTDSSGKTRWSCIH